MKYEPSTGPSLYYTDDYEWVESLDGIAYTGICKFKLTGFKVIEEIKLIATTGYTKKADVLATFRYADFLIVAHMPVDGYILRFNEELIKGNNHFFLSDPQGKGWIAEFVAANRQDDYGLKRSIPFSTPIT